MTGGRCLPYLLVFTAVYLVRCNPYPAAILPEDDVILLEGSPLELLCRVRSPTCGSPYQPATPHHPLYLYHQGVRVAPPTPCLVNYSVEHVTLQDAGVYHCYEEEVGTGETRRVAVPKLVTVLETEKPNFSCVINNFRSMDCSWCDADGTSQYNELSWVVKHEDVPKTCLHMTNGCSCHICGSDSMDGRYPGCSQGGIDAVNQFIQFGTYNFTLHRAGSGHIAPWYFSLEANRTYVRPPAVENLRVDFVNATTMDISWTHEDYQDTSIPNTTYWVIYYRDGVSNKVNAGINVYTYTLTDLRPYTTYDVTVLGTPEGGLYDGLPATVTNTTAEAAPERSPVTIPGGFRVDDSGEVQVIWQSIPEKYQNGRILNYTVTVTSPSMTSPQTLYMAGDVHSVTYVMDVTSWQTLSVTVQGYNTVGASPAAGLTITKPLAPGPVGLLAERNDTHVHVSWVRPEGSDVTNYTLLECQTDTCQGAVKVYMVAGHENHIIQKYTPSTSGYPWYALAANTRTSSSGLAANWLCLYHNNTAIPEVGFSLEREVNEQMKVVFVPPDCSVTGDVGYAAEYLISWNAPMCSSHSTSCRGSATVPSSTHEYTMKGLQGYNYTVRVAGARRLRPSGTKYGPTRIQLAAIIPPVPTSNYMGLKILPIPLGVILVIIIIIFVGRRTSRYIKSNIPQPITPSTISMEKNTFSSDQFSSMRDREDFNQEVMMNLLPNEKQQRRGHLPLKIDTDSFDSGHYDVISIEEHILNENKTKVRHKEKPPDPPPMNKISKIGVKFPEFKCFKEKEEILYAAGSWKSEELFPQRQYYNQHGGLPPGEDHYKLNPTVCFNLKEDLEGKGCLKLTGSCPQIHHSAIDTKPRKQTIPPITKKMGSNSLISDYSSAYNLRDPKMISNLSDAHRASSDCCLTRYKPLQGSSDSSHCRPVSSTTDSGHSGTNYGTSDSGGSDSYKPVSTSLSWLMNGSAKRHLPLTKTRSANLPGRIVCRLSSGSDTSSEGYNPVATNISSLITQPPQGQIPVRTGLAAERSSHGQVVISRLSSCSGGSSEGYNPVAMCLPSKRSTQGQNHSSRLSSGSDSSSEGYNTVVTDLPSRRSFEGQSSALSNLSSGSNSSSEGYNSVATGLPPSGQGLIGSESLIALCQFNCESDGLNQLTEGQNTEYGLSSYSDCSSAGYNMVDTNLPPMAHRLSDGQDNMSRLSSSRSACSPGGYNTVKTQLPSSRSTQGQHHEYSHDGYDTAAIGLCPMTNESPEGQRPLTLVFPSETNPCEGYRHAAASVTSEGQPSSEGYNSVTTRSCPKRGESPVPTSVSSDSGFSSDSCKLAPENLSLDMDDLVQSIKPTDVSLFSEGKDSQTLSLADAENGGLSSNIESSGNVPLLIHLPIQDDESSDDYSTTVTTSEPTTPVGCTDNATSEDDDSLPSCSPLTIDSQDASSGSTDVIQLSFPSASDDIQPECTHVDLSYPPDCYTLPTMAITPVGTSSSADSAVDYPDTYNTSETLYLLADGNSSGYQPTAAACPPTGHSGPPEPDPVVFNLSLTTFRDRDVLC